MRSNRTLRTLGLAVLALSAFGCAPPKVLVNHAYASTDKSIQTFIQKSGAAVGSSSENKTDLFNVYLRVCNQAADNTTANCKDTLILENVNPNSI